MLIIVVLLSFHYTLINGSQCISSHCEISNDCMNCTNVSKTVKMLWENYMQYQMKNYKSLGYSDKFAYFKSIYERGMLCKNYCRNCGLLYGSGYSSDLPFYIFECMHETCRPGDKERYCCRTNNCNAPNIEALKFLQLRVHQKFPILKEAKAKSKKQIMVKHQNKMFIFVVVNFMIFTIIAIFAIFVYVRKRPFKLYKRIEFYLTVLKIKKRRIIEIEQNEIMNLHHEISCSGSGPGIPMITPKTTSHVIKLIKMIGEGRFGCVWLGRWNDDDVAVKILSSRDIRSWSHEKFMYQQNYLRHANILTFITADSRDNGISTELWLITEYHERGSLYNVLKSETVTFKQAIKMSRSITNGLAYLHMDINGIEKKPAIAHRDLKSRNILVKSSGECCIGDLGMALRLCSATDKDYGGEDDTMSKGTENGAICSLPELITTSLHANINLSHNLDSIQSNRNEQEDWKMKFGCSIAGTKRYMAPEILDGSLDNILLSTVRQTSSFVDNRHKSGHIDIKNVSYYHWQNCIEAFKRADIYSYSLILWEISSRIDAPHLHIFPFPYQLPYENLVGSDPNIESMLQVVCRDQIRPKIDIDKSNLLNDISEQYSNELLGLKEFCQIIRECWFTKPTVRLNIMKLKKNMANISTLINAKSNPNIHNDNTNNNNDNTNIHSNIDPIVINDQNSLVHSCTHENSSMDIYSSESDVYNIAPNIVIS